ncbi:MAG TPA: hypothetical protein VFD47_01305 [Actinomycetota bacterium]|nr:hypothetical protein [Actinomycetota bacterium]
MSSKIQLLDERFAGAGTPSYGFVVDNQAGAYDIDPNMLQLTPQRCLLISAALSSR